MLILVLNCGSSSIKADIIHHHNGERRVSLRVQRIGDTSACSMKLNGEESSLGADGASHDKALAVVLPQLLGCLSEGESVEGVGHRVVHGGEAF